jgi:hypothetical protein
VSVDHPFVGLRQWGMFPPQDAPCQRPDDAHPTKVCGLPPGQHRVPCTGVLNIGGEHYGCELDYPHTGWGHANQAAKAIWQ